MNNSLWSLKTGDRSLLIAGGSDARYLPSGHIVFMRDGRLMAVAFNAKLLIWFAPLTVIIMLPHARQIADRLLGCGSVNNRVALREERECGGFANPASGARNDRDFALRAHGPSPFVP